MWVSMFKGSRELLLFQRSAPLQLFVVFKVVRSVCRLRAQNAHDYPDLCTLHTLTSLLIIRV